MQDFFYEHCSLFTPAALQHALDRAGFEAANVTTVFGGQYLWAEAVAGRDLSASRPEGAGLGEIAGARDRFVQHWTSVVDEARTRGPVALWGAGAKGVTFSAMIDPDGVSIDHVIDINPAKQGLFLAGTGLPVLSAQASGARAPRTIIVGVTIAAGHLVGSAIRDRKSMAAAGFALAHRRRLRLHARR